MMVLLSAEIAHPNGSLVVATVDNECPQASRPSCPSTTKVNSKSRTRGGLVVVCVPGWCGLVPKTIDFPLPDQVPLISGIASCARAAAVTTLISANAKARYLIRAPYGSIAG